MMACLAEAGLVRSSRRELSPWVVFRLVDVFCLVFCMRDAAASSSSLSDGRLCFVSYGETSVSILFCIGSGSGFTSSIGMGGGASLEFV